jgi:hypothetical protein
MQNLKTKIDLFEHYDILPEAIRDIMTKYEDAEGYKELQNMEHDFKILGYTFSWGLDAIPYNLRKIKSI